MNEPGQPGKTISQVFEEFLDDQKSRISPRTFSKYRNIIDLYKSYMETYWPMHDDQYDSLTEAGRKYCDTFGPQDATAGFGEFLDYFMPRKVLCGKELIQAAGTVTKRLEKWLSEKGYTTDAELDQQ